MKYYGNHWTSDDGTELQIRFELTTLRLWGRSCPKGGEWEAWRRLDVERDGNGILLETVRDALKAKNAESAAKADLAEIATRALAADRASHADSASNANHATKADSAGYADRAGEADHATKADSADRLAQAVQINITGAVTGAGQLDGSGPVNIPTQGGDAFRQMQAEINTLKARIDGTDLGLDNANSANRSLAARVADLEKRMGDLEARAEKLDMIEVLIWRTNCLNQRMSSAPNMFNTLPLWWGDYSCPEYQLYSEESKN